MLCDSSKTEKVMRLAAVRDDETKGSWDLVKGEQRAHSNLHSYCSKIEALSKHLHRLDGLQHADQ